MKRDRNLKAFLTTMFIKQNKYHAHSVIGHTIKVAYELAKKGRWDLVPAGILHDIAKPLSAYQDQEDLITGEYSFTNHEVFGYLVIKDCLFISDYTKNIVRYHYIIRGMHKAKLKDDLPKYRRLKRIWNGLSDNFKADLGIFLAADDLGKKAWLRKERK